MLVAILLQVDLKPEVSMKRLLRRLSAVGVERENLTF
jgi:hypothetical protein